MNDYDIAASLIGNSEAMRTLRERIVKLAHSSASVLIQGPTGAGKEVVAQAIHQVSQRKGRFVSLNISGIQETMFADAMFGHVRGGFTGAVTSTPGYIMEAHSGTLFMDEIGRLIKANQITLLRVLETHAFRPIGAMEDRTSDFRVLSATNESLSHLVRLDEFRPDLFYRLSMATITVPPLRERREDIPMLGRYFAAQIRAHQDPVQFTDGAIRWLQEYDWPGNVRQLRNVIESATYLADSSLLDHVALRQVIVHEEEADWERKGRVSRSELMNVLAAHQGDVSAVAAQFGKTAGTVYRWLREHGISTWERRRQANTLRRPTHPRMDYPGEATTK